jgi:hypothetical protein
MQAVLSTLTLHGFYNIPELLADKRTQWTANAKRSGAGLTQQKNSLELLPGHDKALDSERTGPGAIFALNVKQGIPTSIPTKIVKKNPTTSQAVG